MQAILSVDLLLTGTADTTKDIAVAQKSSMSAATLIFVVSFVGEYLERERERERVSSGLSPYLHASDYFNCHTAFSGAE